MPKLAVSENIVDPVWRTRCLGCFRPLADCYCAAIPKIDNQTEVLILQHKRERWHAFNTARMVHRALRNSSVLIDHSTGMAPRLTLKPGAGLLFPGPGARLLDEVPAHERPRQLIVIDGTWHHAKTFMRDLTALQAVPRYRIAPSEPSRYRIRREPSEQFLSTVEATVAALRVLEPETRGLDELLGAFYTMVERQLAHPKSRHGWRRNEARRPGGRNIPSALLGDLSGVVAVYAEAVIEHPIRKSSQHVPVVWAARRLATGESFARMIQPPAPLSAAVLGHMQLTEAHFASASPLSAAQADWQTFLRPTDLIVVYNPSTARLLARMSQRAHACLVLKSIDFNPRQRYSTLDALMLGEGLVLPATEIPGRAGQRLAGVEALVDHLRRMRQCAD